MARYTDIDKLIAEYDRVHVGPAGGARKLMVEAPIADVVPRAEVDAKIATATQEKAREIFAEIERRFFFGGFSGDRPNLTIMTTKDFEELKKKYAEVQK